jgi:hypothetical protein
LDNGDGDLIDDDVDEDDEEDDSSDAKWLLMVYDNYWCYHQKRRLYGRFG